ncbi:hypothetical protein EBS02_03745 [bacterium]|nr:hypothetical protein [bacterium]
MNSYLYPISASKSNDKFKRFVLTDSYRLRNLKSLLSKNLPVKVDLRESGLLSSITDQGNMETSIGIALTNGCLEYAIKRSRNVEYDLSSVFLYQKDRTSFFPSPGKTVTNFIDAIEILKFKGCSPALLDSYDHSNFNYYPSDNAFGIASINRIRKAYRLKSIKDIKHSLSEDNPVACLIEVYPSFFDVFVYRTGMINPPSSKEKKKGNHAITIVGYDDEKSHFIVKNCWSKSWGDFGYGYLPYRAFKIMFVEGYCLKV